MEPYNGYDLDMVGSLREMDRILLEAGERAVFTEAAGTASPADAFCDWAATFVDTPEGWAYLTKQSDTPPDIPAPGITVKVDPAKEVAGATVPVIEYDNGTVTVGMRKLLTMILASHIDDVMRSGKGRTTARKAIKGVIRGNTGKTELSTLFSDAVSRLMSGSAGTGGSATRGVADRVWDYMGSDDAAKNRMFGDWAKTARNDVQGHYAAADPSVFDDDTAGTVIRAMLAQERGCQPDDIEDSEIGRDDLDAVRPSMEKLAAAINGLSDNEMETADSEELGKLITRNLENLGGDNGNAGGSGSGGSGDASNGDAGNDNKGNGNAWASALWKLLTSDNAEKNRKLGDDCYTVTEGGKWEVPEEYINDDGIWDYLQLAAKETGGKMDTRDVVAADIEACRPMMQRVASAMNKCSADEIEHDELEQLGERITQFLLGDDDSGDGGDGNGTDDENEIRGTGVGSTSTPMVVQKYKEWYFGNYPGQGTRRNEAIRRITELFKKYPFVEDNLKKSLESSRVVDSFTHQMRDDIRAFIKCMKSNGKDAVAEGMNDDVIMQIGRFYRKDLPTRYMSLRSKAEQAYKDNSSIVALWSSLPKRAVVFIDGMLDTKRSLEQKEGGALGAAGSYAERVANSIANMSASVGLDPYRMNSSEKGKSEKEKA